MTTEQPPTTALTSLERTMTQEGGASPGVLAGVAAGVFAFAGGAASLRFGYNPLDLLDMSITPQPPVYPEVTTAIIAVNNVVREISPLVAGLGLGYTAYNKIRSGGDTRQAALNDFAAANYSTWEVGVKKSKNRVGKFLAGLALIASASTFVVGSTAVQEEVATGPNRVIAKLMDDEDHLIAEHERVHLMGDSSVSSETVLGAAGELDPEVAKVAPIRRSFPSLEVRGRNYDGLGLSFPDGVLGLPPAEEVGGEVDCDNVPVVMDSAAGVEVGDSIKINGRVGGEVVGTVKGRSSMNRVGVYMNDAGMVECIDRSPDFYGALVKGANKNEIQNAIQSTAPADVSRENLAKVLTRQEFMDNNQRFWDFNGTPILLQTIMYLAGFAGIAVANARKSTLNENTQEIAVLFAGEMDAAIIKKIETIRAFNQTGKAALVAAPASLALAAGYNLSEVGLRVGTSIRDISVAYAAMLGAGIVGARRAVNKVERDLDISEAVRGA